MYHSDSTNLGNNFKDYVFDNYGLDYMNNVSNSRTDEYGNLLIDNVLSNPGAIIYHVQLRTENNVYISVIKH